MGSTLRLEMLVAVTEPERVLGWGWGGQGERPRWPWVEAMGTQPFSPFPLPQPLLANEKKIKISPKVAKGWFGVLAVMAAGLSSEQLARTVPGPGLSTAVSTGG